MHLSKPPGYIIASSIISIGGLLNGYAHSPIMSLIPGS